MELRATMGAMTGIASADLKTLYNYVFQLTEEMRYLMNNLDVTNFNDLGLARYEQGRLQVYSGVVEIRASKVESVVEALGNDLGEFESWAEGEIKSVKSSITQTATEIRQEVEAVGNDLGEFESWAEGEIKSVKSSIIQTATEIRQEVEAVGDDLGEFESWAEGEISGVKSSITQTANSVSAIVSSVGSGGTVNAASIVAAINRAAALDTSFVGISADAVNISGFVTFSDLSTAGQTTINGSNIRSGTIEGVTIKSTGYGFDDIEISGANIWVGSGQIFSDSGKLYMGDYGGLTLFSGSSIKLEVGTGGGYWEFSPSGIFWKNAYGSTLSTVVLK